MSDLICYSVNYSELPDWVTFIFVLRVKAKVEDEFGFHAHISEQSPM